MKKEKKQIVFEWFSAASTVCWTGCDSARRRKHLPYFACGGDSGGVGGLRPFLKRRTPTTISPCPLFRWRLSVRSL